MRSTIHGFSRFLSLCLALLLMLPAAAFAGDERSALFDEARAALLTPAEEGAAMRAYSLHTGDSAYVPSVAPPSRPGTSGNPPYTHPSQVRLKAPTKASSP